MALIIEDLHALRAREGWKLSDLPEFSADPGPWNKLWTQGVANHGECCVNGRRAFEKEPNSQHSRSSTGGGRRGRHRMEGKRRGA